MSPVSERLIGAEALAEKGWWKAHQWLILRRLSQFGILLLFMLGPLAGLYWVKGNLSSSLTLGVLPLTDPYVLLQSLAAGHWPARAALVGAAIVLAFYAIAGGRVYCAWVCPVNPLTDLAAWLRLRLKIRSTAHLNRSMRYWILAMSLVVAAATGTVAWEWINPVSMVHRGLLFGIGLSWAFVLMVFLFDLFVAQRGWCGHLCPVGAFYALTGWKSLLRVAAVKREACNDCADCYAVCPEPVILKNPLKGADKGFSPVVLSSACSNCGRCIDVCSKDVFQFSSRFYNKETLRDPSAKGPHSSSVQ